MESQIKKILKINLNATYGGEKLHGDCMLLGIYVKDFY